MNALTGLSLTGDVILFVVLAIGWMLFCRWKYKA